MLLACFLFCSIRLVFVFISFLNVTWLFSSFTLLSVDDAMIVSLNMCCVGVFMTKDEVAPSGQLEELQEADASYEARSFFYYNLSPVLGSN